MALKLLWQRSTFADRLLIFLLSAAALLATYFFAQRPSGRMIVVERDNRILYRLPLQDSRSLQVEGPLGVSTITVNDVSVRFESSPCPSKVCIGMGTVSRSGDFVACVPNRILVRVTGEGASAYDLITR